MNPTHQDGIAEAIVQGAADYLARTSYSCFGEGEGSFSGSYVPAVTETSAIPEQAQVTEAVPEETALIETTSIETYPMETAVIPDDGFYDPGLDYFG